MKQIANVNYNQNLLEGLEEKKEEELPAKKVVTDKIYGSYWRVKQELMPFLKEFDS